MNNSRTQLRTTDYPLSVRSDDTDHDTDHDDDMQVEEVSMKETRLLG